MSTILFNKIIFGPVFSRRLGRSLGINLLPTAKKCCNFNCVYCECGWTRKEHIGKEEFPPANLVKEALEKRLKELIATGQEIDNITFAGNGEPTMHPEFIKIIDDTVSIRNKFMSNVKISVLTNATSLANSEILEALNKIDNCILKLDTGKESTFKIINQPVLDVTLNEIVNNIKKFKGKIIIQSLFVKGIINNTEIDNTTKEEINEWLKLINEIKPELVMIYPIARPTPSGSLMKVSKEELDKIAEKVIKLSIKAVVY
ncbi:MAG: radical SAM protein [Bacteroidales bacterium]|nr:radical SAM protein [Bacteroidales bacterium]